MNDDPLRVHLPDPNRPTEPSRVASASIGKNADAGSRAREGDSLHRLSVALPSAPATDAEQWAPIASMVAAIIAPAVSVEAPRLQAELVVALRRERPSEYEAREAAEVTAWLCRRRPARNPVGLFVTRLRAVRTREAAA